MENILTGFFKGFGGAIGVIVAIVIIAVIIMLVARIVDKYRNDREIAGLLLESRKFLIKYERYEELSRINKYKNELKQNKLPKELAERYSLIVNHYLDVEDVSESRGRCFIGTQKTLVYHEPPKPKTDKKAKKAAAQNKADNEDKPQRPDDDGQSTQTEQEK